MEGKSFKVRNIELKSKPQSRYKSSKVTIPVSQMPLIFDEGKWPEGVCVRKFYQPRNKDNRIKKEKPQNVSKWLIVEKYVHTTAKVKDEVD